MPRRSVGHSGIADGGTGGTVFLVGLVFNNTWKGSAMFALIIFAGVILLLAVLLGSPYRQTWYGRWNPRR